MNDIVAKLDELIAAVKASQLPLDAQLWSAEQIGEYLGVSARTVAERYAVHPRFPKARKPGGGHPRWVAAEVIDWAVTKTGK